MSEININDIYKELDPEDEKALKDIINDKNWCGWKFVPQRMLC